MRSVFQSTGVQDEFDQGWSVEQGDQSGGEVVVRPRQQGPAVCEP